MHDFSFSLCCFCKIVGDAILAVHIACSLNLPLHLKQPCILYFGGGGGFRDRISLYNSLAVLEHLIVQRPHPPLYESIRPLWIWCRVSNAKHSSGSEMWTLQETCLSALSNYPELGFVYPFISSLQIQNYAIALKFLLFSSYFPCSTPVTPNVSAISYCMLGMQIELNSPSDGSADKLLPSLIRGEGKKQGCSLWISVFGLSICHWKGYFVEPNWEKSLTSIPRRWI